MSFKNSIGKRAGLQLKLTEVSFIPKQFLFHDSDVLEKIVQKNIPLSGLVWLLLMVSFSFSSWKLKNGSTSFNLMDTS